jgi:hypothetical protein
MIHPDHKPSVTAEFERTWLKSDLPPSRALSFRADCAKALLATHSEEYRAQLEAQNTAEYEKNKARHESCLTGLPSPDPLDQDSYVYVTVRRCDCLTFFEY